MNATAYRPDVLARFWSRVNPCGPGGCWLWTFTVQEDGYAQTSMGVGRQMFVHRVAYELLVGPIPDGFTIDHVRARGCAHKHCVNVAHMEPVPPGVNTLRGDSASGLNSRKTHCLYGHELAGDNLYVYETKKNGVMRNCRICLRDACRRQRERWKKQTA